MEPALACIQQHLTHSNSKSSLNLKRGARTYHREATLHEEHLHSISQGLDPECLFRIRVCMHESVYRVQQTLSCTGFTCTLTRLLSLDLRCFGLLWRGAAVLTSVSECHCSIPGEAEATSCPALPRERCTVPMRSSARHQQPDTVTKARS